MGESSSALPCPFPRDPHPVLPCSRWSGCRRRTQPSGVAASGWRRRSWAWSGRTRSCGRRSGTWRRPWPAGGGKRPALWTATCGPARLHSSRRTRWGSGWRGQDWRGPASPSRQGRAPTVYPVSAHRDPGTPEVTTKDRGRSSWAPTLVRLSGHGSTCIY